LANCRRREGGRGAQRSSRKPDGEATQPEQYTVADADRRCSEELRQVECQPEPGDQTGGAQGGSVGPGGDREQHAGDRQGDQAETE
jgi:hypothetical protein